MAVGAFVYPRDDAHLRTPAPSAPISTVEHGESEHLAEAVSRGSGRRFSPIAVRPETESV